MVPGQADGNGDDLLAHSDDGEGQTRTDGDDQVLKHLKTPKESFWIFTKNTSKYKEDFSVRNPQRRLESL